MFDTETADTATDLPTPAPASFDASTLIDQKAIDDAVRHLATLKQRHKEAVATIPQAARAVDAAKRSHLGALTAGGDHTATKSAVHAATADHALAIEVVDALEREVARYQTIELPRIQAAAHERLARHALAELAACAVRHDVLEEQHAANDARHREALRLLTTASANAHARARGYLNGGGLAPHARQPTASRPSNLEQSLQASW